MMQAQQYSLNEHGNCLSEHWPTGLNNGPFGQDRASILMNKTDLKVEECKQNLLLQLQAIKDMDSLLVESKKKSVFLQTRS